MAPKKGSSAGKSSSSKTAPVVPNSDHIVFTNSNNNKAGKKKQEPAPTLEPPRPDVKKIIGGASWTGKLPVNLLSEHCQRQKWNKPEYQGRTVAAPEGGDRLHRSWVVLSKADPKTREITKLPPLQVPASHAHLGDEPTPLESRHFAAAYALFRLQSMKNLAMALPPKYRDLWKGEFQQLKVEDVKEGREWKYDADPFAADAKRQEIKMAMEKRRDEQARQPPKAETVTLVGTGSSNVSSKSWDRAPRVELGEDSRTRTETMVRSQGIWNQHDVKITQIAKNQITADMVKSGFKLSHVQEALQFCGSREEVVEWLLIHVPEDCLPSWSFPSGYQAGVSMVTSDLSTDAKAKRLSLGGYSVQLCLQALRDNGGDEALAAEVLQLSLVPRQDGAAANRQSDTDIWREEMAALEAVLDTRFMLISADQCVIESDKTSAVPAKYRFRRTAAYPYTPPVVTVESANIPSYIRLSAVRQAAAYSQENLIGDGMIYNMLEWLESSLPGIIDHPGRLSDLEITSTTMSKLAVGDRAVSQAPNSRSRRVPKFVLKDSRADQTVFDDWHTRVSSEMQKTMQSARQKLPAWSKQTEIVNVVDNAQVTLITGETGSGKSTQAIQFILDDAVRGMRGSSANLICTQPRRVAALSLSERVSAERCSKEGEEVGYIIRGDSKTSARTKITFQTTGVLLRRLQSSSSVQAALANVSHVFIDEVHERSLDTDFLLALIRDALPTLPKLKVVLMSATLNADTFANYFGGDRVGRVHIEGRTYPVQDYYLDDVVRSVGGSQHQMREDDESSVGKTIQGLGVGINYQLIATLVRHINSELQNTRGGILIFMPGTLEIDRCLRALADISNIHGLPLHASLTPAEQRLVFRQPPAGKRKVVVATNVAETSITIEDIVAVIDSGKVKETNYDPVSNIVRLEEVWASQAACKQRRGRAGRVQAGTCYKLFTRNVEANMAAATAPEMHRTPLEQLCLSVKATGSGRNVQDFLARTISPPDSRAVATAIKTLQRIGALHDDRLTGLGTYLSMIPADLRCAKLLVLGTLFDCVEQCLTIAAILTSRSPFVSPRDRRDEAKEARSTFGVADGDLMLDLAAFEQWKELSINARYRDVQDWCSSKFLSAQTLRDVDSTRRQLRDSLIEAGLLPAHHKVDGPIHHDRKAKNSSLLRALIAGALNPQIARIQMPDKKYIASMSGAKELDPDAKTIKYFNEENGRVFVHPSSVLFDAQAFSSNAAFVSYFTKMETSKTFVRDLTPLNAYALLLFGGPIEVDTSGQGILVDGWLRLKGWARIGVLASRLRALLDDELRRRVDGEAGITDDGGKELFELVRRLVEFNGQDR